MSGRAYRDLTLEFFNSSIQLYMYTMHSIFLHLILLILEFQRKCSDLYIRQMKPRINRRHPLKLAFGVNNYCKGGQ